MKYYLIAGEASGDLHGAQLVRALRQMDPEAVLRGWGGDLMAAQGMQLDVHYRHTAFMGFVEVVRNLPAIFRLMKRCKRDVSRFQPHALILIDYPGFNLRMAQWAHAQGIKVCYYISPQVWAWKESRVHTIGSVVDRLYVILPFEADFYARHGIQAHYFGHPIVDEVHEFRMQHPPDRVAFAERHGLNPQRPIVALLPGSRKQEIERSLQVMLGVANRHADKQFVVAAAPSLPPSYFASLLQGAGQVQHGVKWVHGQTWPLLSVADAALVTSGTATLEAAMFGVPQVVCYRGNWLSYYIARRLVKVPYISLVNLIMDEPLVEELIQSDFNERRTSAALKALFVPERRSALSAGYEALRQKLGQVGVSVRVARDIVKHCTCNAREDALR